MSEPDPASNPTAIDTYILQNARRLLDDAQLLLDNQRYASAMGLAVFAFEEVGKCALRQWERRSGPLRMDRRYSYHRRKQAVIGALYHAETATKAYNEFLTQRGMKIVPIQDVTLAKGVHAEDENSKLEEPDDDAVEYVARHMFESKTSKYIDYAFFGVFEEIKHIGLYFDPDHFEGLCPFNVTKDDAEELLRHARKAFEMVEEPILLKVAYAVFRTYLAAMKMA